MGNGKSSSGWILDGSKRKNYRKTYVFDGKIGEIPSKTFRVKHSVTHQVFACKSYRKRDLKRPENVVDVNEVVAVMTHLANNEKCGNIVKLHEVYEDKTSVNLIMELCEGKELLECVTNQLPYSEKKAANLFRQIVTVVRDCHSAGVMHRDLKPQSFRFLKDEDNSPLKAIDFGISVILEQGKVIKDPVGSHLFIAPQVLLKQEYGPEADIWSAGVILFLLLSGDLPFHGENGTEILDDIIHRDLDFSKDDWPSISKSAKNLVRKMLQFHPEDRPTANEVLEDEWLKEGGLASDTPLDTNILSRMKRFQATNKLKRVALMVIAEKLSEKDLKDQKKKFKSLDYDQSGKISLEELKSLWGSNMREAEIKNIMEAADLDGDGMIDYSEFISATIDINDIKLENHIQTAFEYFDRDNNGHITMEELEHALKKYNMGDELSIKQIIDEVDTNKDGKISRKEFEAMMKKPT